MAKEIIERIPCVGEDGTEREILKFQRVGYRTDNHGDVAQHFGHTSLALQDNSAVEMLSDSEFRVVWSGELLRRVRA